MTKVVTGFLCSGLQVVLYLLRFVRLMELLIHNCIFVFFCTFIFLCFCIFAFGRFCIFDESFFIKNNNERGGGRNVEFQNYDWPFFSERRNGLLSWSEHQKSKRPERQKCLLSWSEHRNSKRSEHRKWPTYGVLPS